MSIARPAVATHALDQFRERFRTELAPDQGVAIAAALGSRRPGHVGGQVGYCGAGRDGVERWLVRLASFGVEAWHSYAVFVFRRPECLLVTCYAPTGLPAAASRREAAQWARERRSWKQPPISEESRRCHA